MFTMGNDIDNRLCLADLKRGDRAEILNSEAKGEIRKRLMDMGLIKGVEILVIRKAPLGDPVEIKINGFLLSLRLEEARFIYVKAL